LIPLLACLLAASPLVSDEDAAELRRLAWLRTGEVRIFTSRAPLPRANRADLAGTFPIVESVGHDGRLARAWFEGAHDRAKLRFFADGTRIADVAERVGEGFAEGRPPLLPFWSFAPDRASGAYVTYPPISYRRGLSVTMSTLPDAYEIELVEREETDHMQLPGDDRTSTFDLPALAVEAGTTGVLGKYEGSGGTLLDLALIPDALVDEDLALVRVRIFVDGEKEPGISASMRGLFARPHKSVTYTTRALSVSDTEMHLRLPVPFDRSIRLEIENGGPRAVKLHGTGSLCGYPPGPRSVRLRVRERSGEVSSRQPFAVDDGIGMGHVVGLVAEIGAEPASFQTGSLEIEADGDPVYRSVSLASAFDGARTFGKQVHTTIDAGVTRVGDDGVCAFVLRTSRAIPFERSFHQRLAVASATPVKVSTVAFAYVAPR